MKNISKKFVEFCVTPFVSEFHIFLLLSLYVCAPLFIGLLCKTHDWQLTIWESLHGMIICYIAILPISLIPLNYKPLFRLILCLFGLFDFIIESACWYTIGWKCHNDIVSIVMEGNFSEWSEFFRTYFSAKLLAIVLLAVALLFLILYYRPLRNRVRFQVSKYLVLLMLLFSSVFLIKGSGSWELKFLMKVISFIQYDSVPDLRECVKDIEVSASTDLPDNIVLILGESFSKYHSSLYGYHKDTNPRLGQLEKDSLLCVLDHVISPDTHTIPCIKAIMSLHQDGDDAGQWYEHPALPRMMSELGYKTFWVSNQSPSGISDNVAAAYSKLCDSVIWNGSKVKGVYKAEKDGELLDVLHKLELSSRNFIIIHLMGSHVSYDLRYPKEWSVFSEDDYSELLESQRKVVSSYDNSILYNDYVVNEVFDIFSTKETVAFYFSDHGLDIFKTSDKHFGYAVANNDESILIAKAIPFMVYFSPSAKTDFNSVYQKIDARKQGEFCTENMIKLIMELFGIKISEAVGY